MSASGAVLGHLTASAACTVEAHERIKRDSAAWALLEKIAPMEVPPLDDEPGYTLDLRNCHCGSTLAREVRS